MWAYNPNDYVHMDSSRYTCHLLFVCREFQHWQSPKAEEIELHSHPLILNAQHHPFVLFQSSRDRTLLILRPMIHAALNLLHVLRR